MNGEVRLYDRLFTVPDPSGDRKIDFKDFINSESLEVLKTCKFDPGVRGDQPESRYQFERLGYFCVDRYDSSGERPVFNRTVTLRDTWAKIQEKAGHSS